MDGSARVDARCGVFQRACARGCGLYKRHYQKTMAHPWKADDLPVATWFELTNSNMDHDEATDNYFQSMIDNDDFCETCGALDDLGCCPCTDWDDDCFVGKARPWDRGGWYADLVKLTAKGKRLQRECCHETSEMLRELAERQKIRKARRRWMVLKDAVDAKRIAFYWQEQTQRNLCAGGAGRAADVAAFAEEF